MASADWGNAELRVLCAELRMAAGTPEYAQREEALFLVFNNGDPLEVVLPDRPKGWCWRLHLDTSRPGLTPYVVDAVRVPVDGQSVLAFDLERERD